MFKSIILTSVGVLYTFGVLAQSPSIPTDSLSEELVITHSKHPVSIKSTFKPTIVIGREEVLNEVTDDLGILLDRQVGLSVNSAQSNPAKDKSVFLQGASGEFTLILIDGVPITDPSGIGGSFDLRSISLSQIERIEIVKGGQSALYGSDAVAGVINLITSGANQSKNSGNIKASYGSLNTKNVSASTHIHMGPKLAFNASGSYSDSDGISEALDLADAGFDKDGYNRSGLQASLRWRPQKQLSITPFLRYSSFNGDYDGGAFTDGTDTYDTDWLNGGVSAHYTGDNYQLRATYTHNKTNRTFNSSFGVFDFKGRFNNLDLFGHTQINEQTGLSIGVNAQSFGMIDPAATPADPDANLFSPYASVLWQPQDAIHVEAGLRYNRHSDFGSNINYSLGASAWLTDNTKIFAHWTTSFKAPNLFQLFGEFGANPDLKPQNGRSINLGVSFENVGLFNNVAISAFDRVVDSLIIFDFATGYDNLTSQHDLGLEISGVLDVGQIDINLSYAYLFGELDEQSGADPIENLLRRPKHQVDAGFTYTYARNNSIRFDLRYVGARDDIFFDNMTFLNEAVLLEGYWTGHLYTDYTVPSQNLTLHAEVRNLWDTDFQEVAGFGTVGRNIQLGLTWSF